MDARQEVAAALAEVRARIEAAATGAGRDPASVRLIAVSKLQPAERIEAALQEGQRAFGENYVQEAKNRWPALRERFEGIELHLIGPLQTNKTAEAVALFDVIQTLDREKLARSLVKERDRQGRLPRLYVQVNTGEEAQKAGILPDGLESFLDLCRGQLALEIEGLMAIPPDGDDIAPHAALLAKFARRHGIRELSIGMSADYETAIRFGATQVRVGSAIFGARPPKMAPNA
ncbi:MAG TPA: YggS family pyridoxal phosphate-dependent enzyme [Geminicoccus sp.]|uniref:YggS family pyridoxal phosphate-dependent enzyme n=1 Tax=Geminicoccus sp. TaxID=2024832 RepID=UPI002E318C6C|nr:YggS family pyridoxal phosphate-dependent enzyme [Geminicoccus sp.]HEX2529314.1 YggS family pyridoxal phosphate-dependent enzyme [Geminicoccus sp.]